MAPYKVVSIVSQLPPQVNGVGDYAFYLAEKLQSDFGVETIFIRSDASSGKSQAKFKEILLGEKNKTKLGDLLDSIQAECILLHYVGYAYSSRGCPFWLVQGLEAWKKRRSTVKVITVFHELYANGKLWESAFWFHFFQKNIVRRLLNLSSSAICNSEVTETILLNFDKKMKVHTIPVFSNIGETSHLPDFKLREDVFILFGSAAKRTEVYAHSMPALHSWAEKLKIRKIIEIGPLRIEKLKGAESLEIIELGVLSPSEVMDVFKGAKYGLLQYPLALLSKSGIFAAYAAHGVVPVIVGKHFMNFESNGLKTGIHYLYDLGSDSDQEKVSSSAFKWYQTHNLTHLSSRVFDLIK
jgi:hypothetical protein